MSVVNGRRKVCETVSIGAVLTRLRIGLCQCTEKIVQFAEEVEGD